MFLGLTTFGKHGWEMFPGLSTFGKHDWLGNNVSWFVHLWETGQGNIVSRFVNLWAI